ncbi:hypothetical protein [Butyrivibrio sp. AC2005]|uniref:hypothetical protein n=1 Tax=Butyrivibrio sp. AC2005 TaxID=1280672 RepID=UPI000422328E|nr:hypothetical protein [Butyrivibrio sp. AC2005]
MKGLKQFGAMALAAALTVTLVAPISANAEVISEYEYDANGRKTNTKYTNEDTGESINTRDYDKYEGPTASAVASERTALSICTNSYTEYLTFATTTDVAKFTNFKSNKKALKVKVIKKEEYTDPSNPKSSSWVNYFDKDGNGYYRNVDGKTVKVEAAKLATDMPKGYDYGSYKVRFFTKKAGKYKVTYDAVLKNGTTVKKTLMIYAKENGTAIKSVTFAGKDIYTSHDEKEASKNNLWTKGSGTNVTTAKSGKIKVTMASKDFKLKKIEVGTPVVDSATDKYGNKSIFYKKNPASSLDPANGEGYYTWKKVKNGKKIKLSKVDTSSVGDSYDASHTVYESKGVMTETKIRITYYDKKNKTTHRQVLTLYRIQK